MARHFAPDKPAHAQVPKWFDSKSRMPKEEIQSHCMTCRDKQPSWQSPHSHHHPKDAEYHLGNEAGQAAQGTSQGEPHGPVIYMTRDVHQQLGTGST